MNHTHWFAPPCTIKDKGDKISTIFILNQSGGLTNVDKYLMSCQAFIFPIHESLYEHKLSFYVVLAVFREHYTRYTGNNKQENLNFCA